MAACLRRGAFYQPGRRGAHTLKQGILVPLQLRGAFGASPYSFEFPFSGLASIFKGGEFRPKLVEGDKPLGGHVLKAAPLLVCPGELVEPYFLPGFRVSSTSPALILDGALKPGPQALGILQ